LRLDGLQDGHDPPPELDVSLILELIRIADDLVVGAEPTIG
jgi:hypothetical protein